MLYKSEVLSDQISSLPHPLHIQKLKPNDPFHLLVLKSHRRDGGYTVPFDRC